MADTTYDVIQSNLTFEAWPLAVLDECPLHVLAAELTVGLLAGERLLKAAIDWLTPSASVNCSRSSLFVRPFAVVTSAVRV